MEPTTEFSLRELRRNPHPEAGWKGFQTIAIVVQELDGHDYPLHLGNDAVAVDEQLGVRQTDELANDR